MAPDIFFMLSEEYQVRSGLGLPQSFSYKIRENNNGHALYGIFLAYGPDVKKSIKINDIKIYDVAPTILYLMNIPVPKDMDGRVLKEIFGEDSELATKK